MKKYVYLFSLCLFSVTTNAQIVWEPTGLSVLCPAITVSSIGVIYAGDVTGNFWKSTDNGNNWTSVNIGTTFQIADLAIASNGSMFASTGENETGNGVYRSTDGGATWQHCSMTAGIVAREIKIKSGTIFVSTKDNGLGKSTDNGNTWTETSSSVPEDNIGAFNITKNGTLLIGVKGSNGIYRSTDDGANWTLTSMPQHVRVYSLTVASNNYIFAGTAETHDGIYRSTDDGSTWSKVKTDDYEYYMNGISALDGKIYIGSMNLGVYSTSDFGTTWILNEQGFQSLFGFALAEGQDGTIFATTADGVYKSTGTTSVNAENLIPNDFNLKQNFPNPFNPSTTIQYTVGNLPTGQAGTQFVSLKVYDVLGNVVATLVNEEQHAGVHSVNFEASRICSGVYFYKLDAGEFSETKSMILIK